MNGLRVNFSASEHVMVNCRQPHVPAAPSNPVTCATSSVALLDKSLCGSGSVCKSCGGKILGAAAGNGTVVVRSTETVVNKTLMSVHVTRMLPSNLSACIAQNPS